MAASVCATVQPVEPYAYADSDGVRGFAVEVWEAVAERLELDTTFSTVGSVADQLGAVGAGECDVATTAITMTSEREAAFDFSHPIQEAGLRIAVPTEGSRNPGMLVELFTSPVVLVVLGLLLGAIAIMGIVVWSIERRNNPEFRQGVSGVGDGLWWSAVTAMTVGYGDKVPRRVWGRLLTVAWMLVGVVLVALLTAAVTTELTVDRIRSGIGGLEDLYGKEVLVVGGTTSEEYAIEMALDYTAVESVDGLIDELVEGSVDAAILDGPILEFQADGPARGGVEVVGPTLTTEYHAFAFGSDNELRDEVNEVLLEMIEDGKLQQIRQDWFG